MYEGLKNLEVPRASKHPRARHVARGIMVGALALVIFVVGVGAYTYVRVKGNLGGGIDAELRNLALAAPGDPLNILVIGSDSRKGVTKQDKKKGLGGPGGRRADVIMLLHIGRNGEGATLVSIPRDLRVEIPGHGTQKVNAAYAFGGRNLVRRTVQRFTGVPINHIIDVNFFGFRGIVDAVGGVPVTTSGPIKDDKAKLDIPGAGCWILDGDAALAWVRARQFDPTADIGRISRQQQFLRSLAKQMGRVRILLDPTKLTAISGHIGEWFRYDQALVGGATLGRARAIAARLATLDDRRLDFRIVPSYSATIGGISYLIAHEEESRALFDALRNDTKIPDVGKTAASVPKRTDVSVQIQNGTKRAGFATKHTERLRKKNFVMLSPADTKRRKQTVILYEFEDELKAELVKKFFKRGKIKRTSEDLPADVVVRLGADLLGAADEPAPPEEDPPARDRTCRRLR